MEKIKSQADLRSAILLLEIKQLEEKQLLKLEFQKAYESVRPITLIKNSIKDIIQSDDLKDNLMNSGVGLATGYVSKILFENTSHSRIKKILGTALMFGVTKAITKNPEAIKSMAYGIFNLIKSARQKIKKV